MKLIILPGMDGTGKLLTGFVGEIVKHGISVSVISYPTDRIQSYDDLIGQVSQQLAGQENFTLLGESFSGPIALSLAQRKFPGLRALVLAVTFAAPPESLLLKMTGILPVNLILSLPIPCWLAKKLMFGEISPRKKQENFCSVIKEVEPEVIAGRLDAVRNLRLDEGLIDLPCIYIQGTKDNLLPSSALEGIKRLVPGVVVHQIDGPHLVLDEHPDLCAMIVAEFMNSLEPG